MKNSKASFKPNSFSSYEKDPCLQQPIKIKQLYFGPSDIGREWALKNV